MWFGMKIIDMLQFGRLHRFISNATHTRYHWHEPCNSIGQFKSHLNSSLTFWTRKSKYREQVTLVSNIFFRLFKNYARLSPIFFIGLAKLKLAKKRAPINKKCASNELKKVAWFVSKANYSIRFAFFHNLIKLFIDT